MKMKKWGIFCTREELENTKGKLVELGANIFEVRELSYWEKSIYLKDSSLYYNEPHIIMFYSSTLRYRWILFKLGLKSVF